MTSPPVSQSLWSRALASSGPNYPALAAALALVATAALAAFIERREDTRRDGQAASLAATRGEGPASGAFGEKRSVDEPMAVQQARAQEQGRGRTARSPAGIPWRGWKDIFWRTYNQFGEDRLLAVAAGVVFYGLLALFPAVTAFVSFYGLFASYSTINEHLSTVAAMVPPSAFKIIQDQVVSLVAKGDVKLGFTFLFGLGLALWSANAGLKAIIDALNVAYEEKEKRGFVKLTLISFAFTAGAIACLLLAVGSVVVIPAVLATFGVGSWGETLLSMLRWPLMFAVIVVGLAILYRFGPSRTEAQWKWLSVGSVFAAFTWIGGSSLLSWYISNFANYDATYGSLGAAIGLMMWMWMSAIVVLLGAELNAEIEHQTAQDTTVDAPKPLGARGAVMADTVGKARRKSVAKAKARGEIKDEAKIGTLAAVKAEA